MTSSDKISRNNSIELEKKNVNINNCFKNGYQFFIDK